MSLAIKIYIKLSILVEIDRFYFKINQFKRNVYYFFFFKICWLDVNIAIFCTFFRF